MATERTFTAAEMVEMADAAAFCRRPENRDIQFADECLDEVEAMLRQGAAAIERWEALKVFGRTLGDGFLLAEMTRLEGERDHE